MFGILLEIPPAIPCTPLIVFHLLDLIIDMVFSATISNDKLVIMVCHHYLTETKMLK